MVATILPQRRRSGAADRTCFDKSLHPSQPSTGPPGRRPGSRFHPASLTPAATVATPTPSHVGHGRPVWAPPRVVRVFSDLFPAYSGGELGPAESSTATAYVDLLWISSPDSFSSLCSSRLREISRCYCTIPRSSLVQRMSRCSSTCVLSIDKI